MVCQRQTSLSFGEHINSLLTREIHFGEFTNTRLTPRIQFFLFCFCAVRTEPANEAEETLEADGKTDVTAAHAAYAALRVLDRATWIVGRRPINLGGVKKIVGEVQIYYPDGVQGVWAGCPRSAELSGVDKKG